MPRYAARVDRGSAEIRAELHRMGISVYVIGRPVDWLIGFRGVNYLFELKAVGAKARRDQPVQEQFLKHWPGQVAKVETLDDILRILGL